MKKRYNVSSEEIGKSIGLLARMILTSECGAGGSAPQLIVVCPPPILELGEFKTMFQGGREKSLLLKDYICVHAIELKVHFLDLSKVISSSEVDGIHWDKESQYKVGNEVAQIILSQQ